MSDTHSVPKVSEEAQQLFKHVENLFTKTALGPDRWYIVALASLVGGSEPMMADQLYLYLINRSNVVGFKDRQALMRRLREVLIKLVAIIGIAKPLEAIIAISAVEREEDRDSSFSREGWQADSENRDQGMSWLKKLYTKNTDDTLNKFAGHADFQFIVSEIIYGLFLSDRQILDDMDTEMTVLVGLMIQNLPQETWWHIRGARRIGIGLQDIKTMIHAVREVAKFMGTKLDRIPSPEDVEKEV